MSNSMDMQKTLLNVVEKLRHGLFFSIVDNLMNHTDWRRQENTYLHLLRKQYVPTFLHGYGKPKSGVLQNCWPSLSDGRTNSNSFICHAV